jgi:hypothetical protein
MTEKHTPIESRLDDAGKPICVMCDKRLKAAARSLWWNYGPAVQNYGWQGNNVFCSQKCAAQWGIIKAAHGLDP